MIQKCLKVFYWLDTKFIICLHCSVEPCLLFASQLIPGYKPDFISHHTFQTFAQ